MSCCRRSRLPERQFVKVMRFPVSALPQKSFKVFRRWASVSLWSTLAGKKRTTKTQRQREYVQRGHAMLLSFAGAVMLLVFVPSSPTKRFGFNWPIDTSHTDEAEVDTALQDAANSALANREGTII